MIQAKQKIINNLDLLPIEKLGQILDIMKLTGKCFDDFALVQIIGNNADFYSSYLNYPNFLTSFVFSDSSNIILKYDSFKILSIILQKQMYIRGKKLK
jgi:hypothetical protein